MAKQAVSYLKIIHVKKFFPIKNSPLIFNMLEISVSDFFFVLLEKCQRAKWRISTPLFKYIIKNGKN